MKNTLIAIILIYSTLLKAQFNAVYPIGDKPDIGFKNSLRRDKEKILFEANPIIRMSIYNNIVRRLQNARTIEAKQQANAWYISFRPQIRMYQENSLPVKTPSYRISILGYQHLWRFIHNNKINLLAISYESGHYSNGQADCAFDQDYKDGTLECKSLYSSFNDQTNLSDNLNRRSGNFSTNYTEIIIKNRTIIKYDNDNILTQWLGYKLGIDLYHDKLLYAFNAGGYSDEDIKFYGRARIKSGIDFMTKLNSTHFDRFLLELTSEYITNPHRSVQRMRVELTANIYLENNLGFFISGVFGHDNYNYRFVDSGFQMYGGINFDIFPRIQL